MEIITSLFSSASGWVVTLLTMAGAVIGAWFIGKSKGKTEEKAKSDVTAAKLESQQVTAAATKVQESSKVAADVKTENQSVSDADARSKLQQSKYNRQ